MPILARVSPDAVPAETARELKARIEAERRGAPFLVYREAEGRQLIRELDGGNDRLTVGRSEAADVCLEFDPEVSRVHAEIERLGDDWTRRRRRPVPKRVVRERRASGRAATAARRRRPALRRHAGPVPRAAQAADEETVPATDRPDVSRVTDTQRRVLVALCRPFREGSEFASPATNQQVADEVFLSVDAVKANLRALFETFEVGDLPQNQKRIRLAELALRSGVISPRDLEA